MAFSVYSNDHFMGEAYKQALIAYEENEIPVGAVVVCKNRIVARAYNQTEKLNDATAHAEMLALTSAFNFLGSKYLDGCSLFVTLEPCVMCSGAMYWAQLDHLFYGTRDLKRGFQNVHQPLLHPKTKITGGILEEQCKKLLEEFFRNLRK
jgi:tRNA(adenine34) deaminase